MYVMSKCIRCNGEYHIGNTDYTHFLLGYCSTFCWDEYTRSNKKIAKAKLQSKKQMTKQAKFLVSLAKQLQLTNNNPIDFNKSHQDALNALKDPGFRNSLREMYDGVDDSWNTDSEDSEEIDTWAWELLEEAADQVNLGAEDEII